MAVHHPITRSPDYSIPSPDHPIDSITRSPDHPMPSIDPITRSPDSLNGVGFDDLRVKEKIENARACGPRCSQPEEIRAHRGGHDRLVGAALTASDKDKRAEWRHYLGGQDSASYSTLKQINRSNVTGLEVAWTYKAGANNRLRFNPIVVDDVMYVLGKDRAIVALDAATGKPLWTYDHDPLFQRDITDRGINYWESKDRSQRRLLFAAGVVPAGGRRADRQAYSVLRQGRQSRSPRRSRPRSEGDYRIRIRLARLELPRPCVQRESSHRRISNGRGLWLAAR